MAVKDLVSSTATKLSNYTSRPVHIMTALLDTNAVNMGAADIATLLFIPPRHRLVNTKLEVLTVEGGAATVDVGIFSDAGVTPVDADGLIDGADVNALTHADSVTGAADLAAKGYATGATGAYICLTAVAALDAAVLQLQAEIIPYD